MRRFVIGPYYSDGPGLRPLPLPVRVPGGAAAVPVAAGIAAQEGGIKLHPAQRAPSPTRETLEATRSRAGRKLLAQVSEKSAALRFRISVSPEMPPFFYMRACVVAAPLSERRTGLRMIPSRTSCIAVQVLDSYWNCLIDYVLSASL